MASQQQRLDDILDQYEANIASAFLGAIAAIKSDVIIAGIIKSLEAGNIEAALEQIVLDRGAFSPFVEMIKQCFNRAGLVTSSSFPKLSNGLGHKLTIRFDAQNARAVRLISERSSKLITNITEDQRNAIRAVLTAGMEAGKNPRSVALDIVGRIDKVKKKRVGGILGLTKQQTSFVDNAREELQSGDATLLKSFLQRGRRDKRFDKEIEKAISTGEPLRQETISRILTRYEDNLLKLRGDTIGRTEALESLNTGQQEAIEQAIEKTEYTSEDVIRVWKSAKDKRTRDMHRQMNGQTVKGLTTPFTTPDGYKLKYPSDSSLGAPASETINCRCIQLVRINYTKGLQ